MTNYCICEEIAAMPNLDYFNTFQTYFLLLWPTYLTAAMMKAMTATPPIVPTMTAIMYFSEIQRDSITRQCMTTNIHYRMRIVNLLSVLQTLFSLSVPRMLKGLKKESLTHSPAAAPVEQSQCHIRW